MNSSKYIVIVSIFLASTVSSYKIGENRYKKVWGTYCKCLQSKPNSIGLNLEDFIKCNNLAYDEEVKLQ